MPGFQSLLTVLTWNISWLFLYFVFVACKVGADDPFSFHSRVVTFSGRSSYL